MSSKFLLITSRESQEMSASSAQRYVFSREEVTMDQSKVSAVTQRPTPGSDKELKKLRNVPPHTEYAVEAVGSRTVGNGPQNTDSIPVWAILSVYSPQFSERWTLLSVESSVCQDN